jgi:uncharacterized protein DUF2188
MSGRNFWAVPDRHGWIVREEGLPDQTTHHASREEAWATANERAAACQGEAFLQDENGEILDRQWHGNLPRDNVPV